MIRVGFIGAGNAAGTHLVALSRLDEAQVTAYFDPVPERAQERAAQFGGRPAPSLGAFLEEVDAVWVCSPPHRHVEHATAAARAGRHVFVERPMAHQLEATDQIIRACREADVRLMVGHVLRFVPALQRLRRLADEGDLGNVVACWSRRAAEVSPAEMPWWRRDWRRGGGFTIEWGILELDFLRWVGEIAGGAVQSVHGRVSFSRPAYPDFDDYTRATLTFERGVTGGFEGGIGTHLGGITRAVVGTRATAITEGSGLRLRYAGDGTERPIDVPLPPDSERRANAAVLAEDREFLQAILENRDTAVPGEDGRAALALCLAVHRSSRERREVSLSEMLP